MFDILRFLEDKRDGRAHSPEELKTFVEKFYQRSIPDYQVSAWLMAVFHQGLSQSELRSFTEVLASSGHKVEFPSDIKIVDKHSTGGVGDKTTLVVVPLVAAAGVSVAKLSGRGLSFTGGTVDKLEAIPGMNVHLSLENFIEQIHHIGCAISGHSLELAPAEGLFYALRDVTATVPSLPLIASSIVSKKLAGGASRFVFDVKCGKGAFMTDLEEARALAQMLVSLSKSLRRESMALITAMNQPLGRWVGNSMEVLEAIETLHGRGPADTETLCLHLAGAMLYLGGGAETFAEGLCQCKKVLKNGAALQKFKELIQAQGGEAAVCDTPELFLKRAPFEYVIAADRDGYLNSIDARQVGEGIKRLGGGRATKEDIIDLSIAIEICGKIGDFAKKGTSLLKIYYSEEGKLEQALPFFQQVVSISQKKPVPQKLIMEIVNA